VGPAESVYESVVRARLAVCDRALWRALAGGSSKQVSRRSFASVFASCVVLDWRPPLGTASLSSTVGSPTSPACAVSLSWRPPPGCGRPWAGCSSRTAWRRGGAGRSSRSRSDRSSPSRWRIAAVHDKISSWPSCWCVTDEPRCRQRFGTNDAEPQARHGFLGLRRLHAGGHDEHPSDAADSR